MKRGRVEGKNQRKKPFDKYERSILGIVFNLKKCPIFLHEFFQADDLKWSQKNSFLIYHTEKLFYK